MIHKTLDFLIVTVFNIYRVCGFDPDPFLLTSFLAITFFLILKKGFYLKPKAKQK